MDFFFFFLTKPLVIGLCVYVVSFQMPKNLVLIQQADVK